jgi:hypothetical protein
MRTSLWFLVLACVFQAPLIAKADDESAPEANPGRPTVSTPAALTPTGFLQFETGLLYANHSPEASVRSSLVHVVKLAVGQRFELLLQGEPLVYALGRDDKAAREGELFAGGQVLLLPPEFGVTISVSYFYRLHESAAPEIDIGTFRQGGILLISGDIAGFHFDANTFLNEQEVSGGHANQIGGSLSVSHPAGPFTISGELWRFSQPALGSHASGSLWAVSYSIRKNLVIDAGFNFGLTNTSTRFEAFAGFTYLLPRRLWPKA